MLVARTHTQHPLRTPLGAAESGPSGGASEKEIEKEIKRERGRLSEKGGVEDTFRIA